MRNELKITKLDAARRQLEIAVKLYFNDSDPVSIHTLVCAAHEILSVIKKTRGGQPMILSDEFIKEPYKKEVSDIINKARNFFKHGKRDINATIDFNPILNDYFLLDACDAYELITGEKNPSFVIYRGWFNYKYPKVLKSTAVYDIVKNRFGGNKMKYYSSLMAASTELK